MNSVEKAVNIYRNHSSIFLINIRLKSIPRFSLNKESLSETEGELNLINPKKTTTSNSVLL